MSQLVPASKLNLTLRASIMPLAFKCPGSIRRDIPEVNPVNVAAETGTAAHKCFEGLITNGSIDWESIDSVCDELGGESEEVRFLCARATRIWPKIRDNFPAALTEISVDRHLEHEGLRITGHIDFISIVGDVAYLGDWKTGRKDSNYAQQMKAYMAMVLLAFPQLSRAVSFIVWVREEELQPYSMTQDGAEGWLRSLKRHVVDWDEVYRPGDHCQYCKRTLCPAQNALMRRELAIYRDVDVGEIAQNAFSELERMGPDAIMSLFRTVKLVGTLTDRMREVIRSFVRARGDIVPDVYTEGVSDTKLTIVKEPRRELDVRKAWDILTGIGFTDEDFAACVKMSISKVEKRVAENAGKGYGAKAKRALSEKLELAGAIEVHEIEKLVERKV